MNSFENELHQLIIKYELDKEIGFSSGTINAYLHRCLVAMSKLVETE